MSLTDYHAKYFAYELTKRCASDSVEKLAAALSDAQVDLNPHQVEAALFAFRNPFSRGAILADEVGLGKTIEAGLLISQKWAERKRRLLVIVPANLRKQWSQELADKFHLPSAILENRSFNEGIRAGNLNPFHRDGIVLCSYQFARTKEPYLRQTDWDLVVIDEAHRLRNVYKSSSKIATAIKQAVAPFPKVLLTATPLQNSLLELYGLVSIIDDYAFGDFKSFRARFARLGNEADFAELKERLRPLCKRTLRKQVLQYVKYTNRHALVQEFVPTVEEQRLYDLVSDYLQQPTLYALPASQRQLMTLILRKLLASSTYAISSTLDGLASKLEVAAASSESVDALPDELSDNLEELEELTDEWEEDEDGTLQAERVRLTQEQLAELRQETAKLREFHTLAKSIIKNSKGEVLLTALRRGFAAAAETQQNQVDASIQQKAIIFTESRRTQEYLLRVLEETEFADKVLLFNGTNNDPKSKEIYHQWLKRHAGTDRISGSPSADMRAALVDYFREEAAIMIATEAAAEGINLQFCNLVVNYDLPWNPQRIEQRIGRCHRYGQQFDVVVVNFLNKKNAADLRVYQLLDEKFRLFNGVFGASDEVLGAVESGVDFEKRIATIYQKCRTPEQIQFEFDALQQDLEAEIAEGQRDAREKLLNNFDQDVVEKVRIQSRDYLDRFEERLWRITRYLLAPYAHFEERNIPSHWSETPSLEKSSIPAPIAWGRTSKMPTLTVSVIPWRSVSSHKPRHCQLIHVT
jgi:SNF2 family DNA or RNA helicase